MNEFLSQQELNFFTNSNVNINTVNFIINLLTSVILSYIVQLVYRKCSNSISNKNQFSKNFVVLGVTTCIVITIVKSSLALSLGLVGALSIVRFRAAIKEPEELIYLFLIITAGLGCGAGQIKITVIGIIISILTIFIYSKFEENKEILNSNDMNLSLMFKSKLSGNQLDEIIDIIIGSSDKSNLISMNRINEKTIINIELVPKNFKTLHKNLDEIRKIFPTIEIILSKKDDIRI